MTLVFPAYAGMFLGFCYCKSDTRCFPRVRGDVPRPSHRQACMQKFSPRTRGCSVSIDLFDGRGGVFPAYAGMFRIIFACSTVSPGFPRVRGDVPQPECQRRTLPWFSPRTRGCSWVCICHRGLTPVFPAYAGMFRKNPTVVKPHQRFPRVRGDVPCRLPLLSSSQRFSPRTRGCSHAPPDTNTPTPVFPAYAGMFLRNADARVSSASFPRVRGDVPPTSGPLTSC